MATNKPGKTIKLSSFGNFGTIAANPNGKTLYVLNVVADTVTPIELPSGTVGKPISVARGAGTMAITSNGKTLYVASQAAGVVTPIRTATNTKLAAIKVGPSPIGMIFGP